MPRFYHGSVTRYLVDATGYWLRQIPKSARAVMARRAMAREFPALATAHEAYRWSVKRRDWTRAHGEALSVVPLAEQAGHVRLMGEMAAALDRMEDYGNASRLALKVRHLTKGLLPNEWNGEDLTGRVLLIDFTENAKQSIGRVIRHARLAGVAARQCARCIALVEPRLVPLLKRSYPALDVRPALRREDAAVAEANYVASFEQLAAFMVPSRERIEASFAPLQADMDRAGELRKRYSGGQGVPLIGLSWGSKSHEKDVPGLSEWAQWMHASGARFVSLQYGAIDSALARLRDGDASRLIEDPEIDQLRDMEAFAAQLAALDGVISISNTAAHLAGAMGIPSVFLIDDKFHTTWPVGSDRSPWYPGARLVHKNGRPWREVLQGLQPPARLFGAPVAQGDTA